MKRFKRLFPVLLCACLLSMAACEDNTQKELERMRGEWVSKAEIPFLPFGTITGNIRSPAR